MNWEETIKFIRNKPEFSYLVEKAYFEEDLPLNVERFRTSEEFIETLKLFTEFHPNAKKILDIGSGNGISSISLALEGYDVVSIEPDTSDTIGAGAIKKLKSHYNLSNLEIHESFAEEIEFAEETFDVVYARQCMHHAYNLEKFIEEASRVLKRGGSYISIRDHVIFDDKDKEWFLATHPLQKFYGGENAFTPSQYKNAMHNAGLKVVKELKYYDSVINYFPLTKNEIDDKFKIERDLAISNLSKRIGLFSKLSFLQKKYLARINFNKESVYNEKKIPGRMHSYIALKK